MMAFRFVPALVPLFVVGLAATAAQAQAQTQTSATSDDEMVVSAPVAPLPTATAVAKPASNGTPLTTDEQIKAWIKDAPKLSAEEGSGGDNNTDSSNTPALRQVHGSAGVSVGSNGYSSAYVSALIPVGKDGTLGIAVSQADYGGNTIDHGRIRLPRGRSQSVAVSLELGNGDGKVPDGCPGFMDGDRYIEPVWMSRLHPELSCATDLDRHAETTPGQ